MFLLFVCVAFTVHAQRIWDTPEFQKITVDKGDSVYMIHITKDKVSPKRERLYCWFSEGAIHQTRSTYSGFLLDGDYEVTNANGDLIIKGYYHKGERSGEWYYPINADSTYVVRYKDGEPKKAITWQWPQWKIGKNDSINLEADSIR